MAVYRRSLRSRFTLLLLVLTAVTLITLDERGMAAMGVLRDVTREIVAPVQTASDRLFAPVGDFVGGIVHYGKLEAENAQLRQENAELRGAVLRADDAERERRALYDQLDLTFVDDIPRAVGRVVAFSPSNTDLTVEIDKGSRDGVGERMPVVTGEGLVGMVVDVSPSRSVVRLLTDERFSVGVQLSSSGDVGVADGRGPGRDVVVELIDPATEVAVGEVVVTSGLQQSLFPSGIPVGRVRTASAEPNRLQQDITLRPVVDFDRLEFVSVLQWGQQR